MIDEFKYAIETLKIEKYRSINLLRIIRVNAHEAQTTAFAKEEEKTEKQLKQLEFAIATLERVERGKEGGD